MSERHTRNMPADPDPEPVPAALDPLMSESRKEAVGVFDVGECSVMLGNEDKEEWIKFDHKSFGKEQSA